MRTIALATMDGRGIASEVRIADSFIARALGLLRDRSLGEQQGLLLVPGGSIHTIGMRFPIDVVFLDRRMRVLALAPHVAPQRFCFAPPEAARVLELAAGRIAAVRLPIGAYVVVPHEADERAHRAARRTQSHLRSSGRCIRPPIQFSLRLPLQRCAGVQSDLGCTTGEIDRRGAPDRTTVP